MNCKKNNKQHSSQMLNKNKKISDCCIHEKIEEGKYVVIDLKQKYSFQVVEVSNKNQTFMHGE